MFDLVFDPAQLFLFTLLTGRIDLSALVRLGLSKSWPRMPIYSNAVTTEKFLKTTGRHRKFRCTLFCYQLYQLQVYRLLGAGTIEARPWFGSHRRVKPWAHPSGTSLRETGVETTAGSSGLGLAPSHNRRDEVATSQWKVVPCDLGVVWFHMTVRVRGCKRYKEHHFMLEGRWWVIGVSRASWSWLAETVETVEPAAAQDGTRSARRLDNQSFGLSSLFELHETSMLPASQHVNVAGTWHIFWLCHFFVGDVLLDFWEAHTSFVELRAVWYDRNATLWVVKFLFWGQLLWQRPLQIRPIRTAATEATQGWNMMKLSSLQFLKSSGKPVPLGFH